MTDERWQRMWDLFHDLRERPGDERAARLDAIGADDPELRREVEDLLAEHDAPSLQVLRDTHDVAIRGLVLRPGDRVGPYRILASLGEGGMGVVYRAEQDEPVRRTVAVKLIRPGMDTREVVGRFEAERRALAGLEHDRIARVFDAGVTDDGRPYFAMEYVDGQPITTYCDERRLPLAERLDLFLEVCEGVQHAHRRGIIHRDLKPSNVLVREVEGRASVKIIDFGIARATGPVAASREAFTAVGRILGTPEYMSPEQAGLTGDDVDTRTDVYALGVLLYELLVGANPFDWQEVRRAGYDEILRIIRETEPPRPSTRLSSLGATAGDVAARRGATGADLTRRVRGDLDCIVLRAMDKERDRRYGSPADLAADLARYRSNRPIEARPPSPLYRARKFARRHRVAVAAGAAVAIAIVAGVAVGVAGLVRARAAEREAKREAAVAEEVSRFLVDLFQVSEPGEAAANSLTAREVLDRGVENVRTSLADRPEVRGRLLRTLGGVYTRLGLYGDARPLLDEALDVHRGLDGGDGVETAATLSRLAGLDLEAGRYDEALRGYEQVRAIDERERGPDHPDTVLALENIGTVLEAMHRPDEAVEVLRRAAGARERIHGAGDPETAKALYRLSVAETSAGDLDAAAASVSRAIRIFENAYGDDHPWLQYSWNALAVLYWRQGRLEDARPLLERALASIERTHGTDHPYAAQVANNLGYLHLELGDPEGARPYIERALAIQEAKLGRDHPEVAITLLNDARLHAETDDPAGAEERYARGIRIRETAFGTDDPGLAGPLRGRARALRELGRAREADALDARADDLDRPGSGADSGAS